MASEKKPAAQARKAGSAKSQSAKRAQAKPATGKTPSRNAAAAVKAEPKRKTATAKPKPKASMTTLTPAPKATARPTPPSNPTRPAAPSATDRAGLSEREAIRVFALASDHHRNGRLDDAIRGYTRALALNPNIPDIYNNIGVALRAQGKLEAAIACYQRALAIKPDNAGVFSNLGNALRELGRLEAAAASMQRALRIDPKSTEGLYNLGLVLRDMGEAEKAMSCFEAVLKAKPDHAECHFDRALLLLQSGDYARGFAEYEWRWKLRRSPPRGFRQPIWNGKPFPGKTVLLHQEQGFGDVIQFARYATLVKKLGGTVVLECQPELARLMATIEGVDKVVMRGAPLPPFDFYAPMLTLPKIMGTTIKTVPAKVPYVKPPELHNLQLPVGQRSVLKVGIAWAGKSSHRNDRNRSATLPQFMDLMGLPGIIFYSLQKGDVVADLRKYAADPLIYDVGRRVEDFADTAAVINQLDLVITVDTSVAHLAGALGRPVWVMLPHVCDWRWPATGERTPWYPTMRLYRQPTRGAWDQVFSKVRQDLREALVARAKGQTRA